MCSSVSAAPLRIGADSVHKFFPVALEPREGQLKALELIKDAFDEGKKFFVLEGPTGFGKSALAKAVLNLCGTGFITSPLNTLVSQYSHNQDLALTEVRGQATYSCRAFHGVDCERASELFKDHSSKCFDYIAARDAFWKARHSVTNVHFLAYAPPIEGAFYPRKVLVVDEAHNLEEIIIRMGRRSITPQDVKGISALPLDLPGEEKELLNRNKVEEWLRYFDNAITIALKELSDGDERREYEGLRDAINFTLTSGDWITWKEKANLLIAPMSAKRAAKSLFRCASRVLLMSATMGDIPLLLKNLGIGDNEVAVHRAECTFPRENRKIIYRNLGSMSKKYNRPGLATMLQECSLILRNRPDERGIIHCHSWDLQNTVYQHLQKEFGRRILTHRGSRDRDRAIQELRVSANGVLCSVAMTEGLDLRDDDARFCIFAKIPWGNLSDPYIAERRKRSQDWYENMTALSVIQGSGRVVRSATDHADTFIFDGSFERLLPRLPDWWKEAIVYRRDIY
jgi:Rad3-related DNA helicase